MLEQVINHGAEEGSDEHYYATQLLKKKENRDLFITLKTPNGRLNWLRRAWEVQNDGLRSTSDICTKEALGMFLWTCGAP